jgi:diphosphomevalonate decarboxylase
MTATAIAHTNIALIKYWGKKDADLRLPLMNSISLTLNELYTQTSFELTNGQDQFFLNGQLQSPADSKRVFNYVHRLQAMFGVKDHFVVKSQNHVPTSAGLASSSSAFAALAGAFAQAYNLNLTKKELSRLARLGSGSAARSVYGGFAEWQMGSDLTSVAVPIEASDKLNIAMLVVELNTAKKKTSSTSGMQQAQTSPFYQTWLDRNQLEITEMKNALAAGNLDQVGALAELNASEMHAINLTAQPGFTYFEPATIAVLKYVHELRNEGFSCYYTMDAGPNVKVICSLKNCKALQQKFATRFPGAKMFIATSGPGLEQFDH